ncbi:MAG: lipase maturation factor family protein [Gammaproteobacteria bacterium]
MTVDPTTRPLLIYDRDCAFCTYSVRYWQRLTGDRVRYASYQRVAGQYPDIPLEHFQRSIQLVLPAGPRYSGAEAAFRILDLVPGKRVSFWLYRSLPGFAWIAERVYTFISRRRTLADRLSRFLWGNERYPASYQQVSWLFLRLLGCVYLAAFVSFGVQATGLVGADGILPLEAYLRAITDRFGAQGYWLFPSVFWIDASNTALQAVCLAGAIAAVLLILNIASRTLLVLLFALYLSVYYAGQVFMSFQWDILLLETGFLAIFLAGGSRIVVWLYRWLLFRFMFLSGAVKLLSHDPSWANLTALNFHYETQPLPTPLAWYVHHWPEWFHQVSVGATFFIELVVPFLIFLPRRLRHVAAGSFLLLQGTIVLTGNYNFFNLLTMALCLFLFDDRAIKRILPHGLAQRALSSVPRPGRVATVSASLVAAVILTTSGAMLGAKLGQHQLAEPFAFIVRYVAPWQIVNNYGLFAVMTTTRPEIIVEGSNDARTWRQYEFTYKPGDTARRPTFIIPHQPRLDWQMWFAALGSAQRNPWFQGFLVRLLQGSPDVLALLDHNPFPEGPPTFVRASLYRYRFSTPDARAATGKWWVRVPIGMYVSPIRLAP